MQIHKKYMPLIIGAAVAAGIFIGGKLSFTDKSDRLFTSNSKKDKLNRLIDYIDYEYVDDVNTDSIVDVTVNRILDNLDPHSTYIPKKDLQSVTENMQGDFVGIGISFYTFQTLSYTIDVYKQKFEPTKDFIAFGAFVSFFPQLVAGTIERAKNLLPQFYTKRLLIS